MLIPVKCNKEDLKYLSGLNQISAEVWNNCIEIDKKYKEETGKSIGLSELEKRTKGKFPLHAKGIHHAVFKYLNARKGVWEVRKSKTRDCWKAELPYKQKKYLPTGWDYQSIRIDYKKKIIYLAKPKNFRDRIKCRAKTIPQNIVEIELVFKDKYYLAIKYKEENNMNVIQSNNAASIDLGEIHAITSIDNNGNCIIITNRKVRSLIRLADKRQEELKELLSKCTDGSIRYKKLSDAIVKIKITFGRKIDDAIHKMTKVYLDWCIKNDISTVYYGDVDGAVRDQRKSRFMSHKLHMWRFGLLVNQLENKLSRYGIKMVCVKEYYTSQQCPICGQLNKTSSRNYSCTCGYKQHRDIVGAINILNNNSQYKVYNYNIKEYLQIT